MAMPKRWEIRQPDELDVESSALMQSKSVRDAYIQKGNKLRNREVMAASGGFLLPQRLTLRRQLYAATANDPDQFMRIAATPDGKTAGLIYGFTTQYRQELQAMYVDSAYHGSGLAFDLAEEFLDWTDEARPVELGVVDDNYKAQAFYRKIGFTVVENSRAPVTAWGIHFRHLDEVRMIREAEVQ